jgi:hypothetical protein
MVVMLGFMMVSNNVETREKEGYDIYLDRHIFIDKYLFFFLFLQIPYIYIYIYISKEEGQA